MDQPSSAPAGWYPDPVTPGLWRWWDGTRWTEHAQPMQGVPAVQPWVQVKATATPDGVPLAGLGARLGARIIDSVLLSVAQLAVVAPFAPSAFRGMIDYLDAHQQELDQGTFDPFALYVQTGVLRLLLVAVAASVLLSAAYTVTLVRLRGATLGKMLVGVRVRSWEADGRPTWAQALQRWLTGEFAALVVGLYSLVDSLWPCWDDRKQALHDKWPGTVVVTDRRP